MTDVTVIIPTYNRQNKLIKRAVKSILIQTNQNFEILIIDDNKDAKTSENVKSLISSFNDKRIKYLKNEVNMGGAKSRNKGISHATGRYISFLDDDDFYLKDKLEKQVNFLDNSDFDFVISNLAIVDTQMNIKDLRTFGWFKNGCFTNQELITEHYKYHLTGTPTFMFKKELLTDVKGFPNVSMGHEFHLVDLALRKGYKLGYLDEYFTIAVAHEGNRISTSTKRQEQLQELLEYKLTKLKNLKLADKKRILYRHFLASTSNYLTQKQKKAAIITAIKAVYCKPVVFLYDVFKIIAIKINNKGVEMNELK